MLLDPTKTKCNWTNEDLIKALKLYNISTKAYAHVRENFLPLPSESFLRTHLAKMTLQPEKPIQSVFSLLNARFIEENYYSQATLAVIALDEMSIDSRFVYDKSLDQVLGGVKNATLFCARGVFSSWKQPLLYSFNGNYKHLLDLLIKLLAENGVNVVGVVSDMGPKNVKMWKELGIAKVEKGILSTTNFPHPIYPKDRVYWLTDFPHLLKRLRDHLLDSSIMLPGGTVVNRTWIQELILKQKSELKLTFKLGLRNLYLKGQERQNCSTAYQLFSHSVATAIRVIMRHWEGYNEVADFFDMINDLSDLFNTRLACDDNNKFKAAYGMYIDEQEKLLETTTNVLMNSRIGIRKTKTYAPFQKGFLMLIKSTRELFEDLRTSIPGMKYIMLARFNQDFLESVFSVIRSYGGFNANPNCVQFKHRLRKLVLAWNFSNKTDLHVDYDTLMRELRSSFVPEVFADLPSEVETYMEDTLQQTLYVDPNVDIVNDYSIEAMDDGEIIQEGGKEYIAGYIAAKLRCERPELSADLMDLERRNLWVSRLSKGRLVEPSAIWLAYFNKFEEYFRTINPPTSIDMSPGVMLKLSNFLIEKYSEVPVEVISFYARCRVHIRIKYLNKLMEDERYNREHQRHLSLQAELEEIEESGDDIEELSVSGEELLEEFFK